MNIISKWITERYKQKYLAERYESNEVIHKLTMILFSSAIEAKAEKIVFGKPDEPHPELDMSLLQYPQPASEEIDPMFKDMESEYLDNTFLTSSAKKMIPVWMKTNEKWKQSEGIPFTLLNSIIFHIEGLCNTEINGIEVENTENKNIKIDVSIGCEDNFNYSLKLQKR